MDNFQKHLLPLFNITIIFCFNMQIRLYHLNLQNWLYISFSHLALTCNDKGLKISSMAYLMGNYWEQHFSFFRPFQFNVPSILDDTKTSGNLCFLCFQWVKKEKIGLKLHWVKLNFSYLEFCFHFQNLLIPLQITTTNFCRK